MPLVTVVTAAKNAAPFIAETLASIRAQTISDIEHVVVDDGSTDDTAAIVERAAADDKRVRLVRLETSIGPYAAANLAMRYAQSEYLARIDADDLAVPNRLEVQVAAMRAAPSKEACASAFRTFTSTGIEPRIRIAPSLHNGALKWMLWQRNGLAHSTLLIRTQRFVEMGGYGPAKVAEDYGLWTRLARERQIAVVDDPLLFYRRWPGQITAAEDTRDQPERSALQLQHIQACDDGPWTLQDARDFKYLGRVADFPVRRALSLIDAWESAWRRDASLVGVERRELVAYGAHRRAGHLRQALRGRRREAFVRVPGHLPSFVRAVSASKESRQRWR